MAADAPLFIGIDVGTNSVRAGLVTSNGLVLKTSVKQISINNPKADHYEQSSDEIWQACCITVREVSANIENIGGIGFDATCSLVVLTDSFQPVSVSSSCSLACSNENQWNVVMWMDHRAKEQAEKINRTKHDMLKYVGNKISLEMESPKLLWLKEELPNCWSKAFHFFDLPDYLTWRASGSLSRSTCSLTTKWMYKSTPEVGGWDDSYWKEIGLPEITEDGCSRIGARVQAPGSACGQGLTVTSAKELGLLEGTPVGSSMVDAYAGMLGIIGCQLDPNKETTEQLNKRLSMICGTSTCHLALSGSNRTVEGIWGPFYSVVIAGIWVYEAGQSAAGKLIDHVIERHASYSQLRDMAASNSCGIYEELEKILEEMAARENLSSISRLTEDVHVWPDFHGNRSPLSDPTLRGMILGLTLSASLEDLARLYLATIQALAYGSKHIIETIGNVETVVACGGLGKNKLYIQAHADVTGLPVILPAENESVLLGAAMLGAVAAGYFHDLKEAVMKMGGVGKVVQPNKRDHGYHSRKYKVFHKLRVCQQESQVIMNDNS